MPLVPRPGVRLNRGIRERRVFGLDTLLHPSTWNVRARSAFASGLVVSICLVIAGSALLLVLFSQLEQSAQNSADARAGQIVDSITDTAGTTSPLVVDGSLLATDGQIGVIQVVANTGSVLARSANAPGNSLVSTTLAPSESRYLGRAGYDAQDFDGDYWLSGRGAQSSVGPVTVLVGADRAPVETVAITVAILLAIGAPIVVALVAYATYRIVGASLRPVEDIRSRVSSISTGQLDERVPVPPTEDEIARLAATMNDMLARLESGHQAQQRFISDASHELRSPLSTIIAALELAQDKPELIDSAMLDDSLVPEARRMRQLVEDLLVLARADEHGPARRFVDVDLDDILYTESARLRNTPELHVHTAIEPARVAGNLADLTRAVRNLVDNAVRHSASEIYLECGTDSSGLAVITVEDDGPGIAASDRQRVFERFVRLDSPRARESGGAGLGLAIVSEIVAAHHGSVSITGGRSGGAKFELRLPVHSPSAINL